VLRADLDPVRLLVEIRSAQQGLVVLADAADATRIAASAEEKTVPIETFVSGLRTAWQGYQVPQNWWWCADLAGEVSVAVDSRECAVEWLRGTSI
jgi:hypothetical protein